MAQFTAWHDYLNGQLSMAVIDERYAESAVSLAEAKSLIVAWGTDKESVNVAKAQRETDPEVIQLKEVQLGSYAHRKLVEMLVNNAERDGATLSRELSRRLGRQEINERRTMRWNP